MTADKKPDAEQTDSDVTKVKLVHPDGSKRTVVKPSAEYTNLVGVYGWKEA